MSETEHRAKVYRRLVFCSLFCLIVAIISAVWYSQMQLVITLIAVFVFGYTSIVCLILYILEALENKINDVNKEMKVVIAHKAAPVGISSQAFIVLNPKREEDIAMLNNLVDKGFATKSEDDYVIMARSTTPERSREYVPPEIPGAPQWGDHGHVGPTT